MIPPDRQSSATGMGRHLADQLDWPGRRPFSSLVLKPAQLVIEARLGWVGLATPQPLCVVYTWRQKCRRV